MEKFGTTKFCSCFFYITVSTLLIAVAGCSPSSAPDEADTESAESSVLRRGNGDEPFTLDPILVEEVHEFNILADLYEGLVAHSADGKLIPAVAKSWEISSDGLRYTFHIDEKATWSNANAVTAQHFVIGFQRAVAPGSVSPYSFLLAPIRNYAAVADGSVPLSRLGVRALDERTLIIELASPAHYLLNVLAMPIAYPSLPLGDSGALRYRDPDQFVGNGPYLLDEWQIGSRIRLMKNARYRNADEVQINRVDYYSIGNQNSELNMYLAGELDITATVPTAAIGRLRTRRPGELRIAHRLALYYLAFDLSEPPFDNVVLRQALTMAIDRQVLVAVLGRGDAAAFGLVPSGVANHKSAQFAWKESSNQDRNAQALELLAQAGYNSGRLLRIKLTYDVGDIHEKVVLAVSSMWRDVLGVEVDLEKKEWKYFLATREERSAWQVMRFAWIGDYNDASTFTDIFRSDSPQNLPGYRSAEYDRLLDDASNAQDASERAALMTAAENHLINEYPISPLYFYASKHLVSPSVENFMPNLLDRHPSQYMKLIRSRSITPAN